MNKVITISLNGNAYQLEEAGYEVLSHYLDQAWLTLAGNPDAEEILRDLEAAIAEKLSARRASGKTVSSSEEVRAVLAEMGPVNGGSETSAEHTAARSGTKRLYRLKEGKMVFGVCTGLAAYLDIDVTVVRVVFVALLILTGGGWGILYFIMTLVVPEANTLEQRSAAHGAAPVTAQELIDRAKKEYAKWDKSAWRAKKQEWKRQMRYARNWQQPQVRYYRSSGVIGELFQLAFIGLLIWLAYHYVPSTDPFFNHLGALIQQGWAWLNAKVAT